MYSTADEEVYGADFETDHDGSRAWICQWSISNGTREYHGSDLSSWMDFLGDLWQQKKHSKLYVYFHNLKYDLQFFKSELRQFADERQLELQITMRRRDPIQITLRETECSMHANSIVFRDSMKKIPGKLKAMAKSVGMKKLDSPRHGFTQGWSADLDYSEDSEDWTYIDNDARIVAVAMRRLHRDGFKKATASGDTWHQAQEWLRKKRPKSKQKYLTNLKWDEYFPHLDLDLDMFLRRGYCGGLNISMHQGDNIASVERPIVHEDVHNMYGGVMDKKALPIGLPIVSDRPPTVPGMLYAAHLMVKLELKSGCFPWLQFKNGYDNQIEGLKHGEPIVWTQEYHEMVLTSVDLELIEEWYHVEMDPEWTPIYWIFKSKTGVFTEYLDYWTEKKEKAAKGSLDYTISKLMINSLYGRFALAPETEIVHLEYDEQEDIWEWISEAGVNETNDSYIPFAMFVTAWARRILLDNCRAVGCDNVIHCDTDSVVHFGEPVESPRSVHGEHRGTWGIESRPSRIYEGGFKRYIEILSADGEIHSLSDVSMAAAGVPQDVDDDGVPIGMWVELLDDPSRITMTGYTLGHTSYSIKSRWLRDIYIKAGKDPDSVSTMKLIPENVPGGVILRERQHALNDNLIYRLRRRWTRYRHSGSSGRMRRVTGTTSRRDGWRRVPSGTA